MDLEAKMTQKLSLGRGMVTAESITEFKDEVVDPMLADLRAQGIVVTLNDAANSDECAHASGVAHTSRQVTHASGVVQPVTQLQPLGSHQVRVCGCSGGGSS